MASVWPEERANNPPAEVFDGAKKKEVPQQPQSCAGGCSFGDLYAVPVLAAIVIAAVLFGRYHRRMRHCVRRRESRLAGAVGGPPEPKEKPGTDGPGEGLGGQQSV